MRSYGKKAKKRFEREQLMQRAAAAQQPIEVPERDAFGDVFTPKVRTYNKFETLNVAAPTGLVSQTQAVPNLREMINEDTWPAHDPVWKWELSEVLKDFTAKYFELTLNDLLGDTADTPRDEPSKLWHIYFVESLYKLLKELPASTDDLRKAVHELAQHEGDVAKGSPASPVNSSDVNKKRPAPRDRARQYQDSEQEQARQTEAETPSFTVYARSPYTVRVFEGDIPSAEFSSSTPATVRVKMVPGSAVSAAAVVKSDDSDN
ncbi:hypothetical protein N0V85_006974 [Neurospora sp. IMI 360204]|nr:hypothetical protein N0V85_006974 [Neurospora sp. IMI 360204]